MKRQDFLKLLAASPLLIGGGLKLSAFERLSQDLPKTDTMPALFIGHGHPMNALFDNSFTQALQRMGQEMPRPQAIMVVSAHWETRGTFVSVNPQPKTIYDFGGFDPKLSQIKYEPAGHPTLAKAAIAAAEGFTIREEASMGLDHGAWTVLKHIYPKADVPVFQLSLDYTQPPAYHFQLATALKKLRQQGVLILGSGNIVHNLGILDWHNMEGKPFDWAVAFDQLVKEKLDQGDFKALVEYQQFGKLAQMAIPSNDHYLPMLYTLGLAYPQEQVKYLYEGIHYGSISMRCFRLG